MTFVTWNLICLYRAGFLTTAAKELSKYRWDLLGVKVVRWDSSGTEPAKWNENHKFFFFWGRVEPRPLLARCTSPGWWIMTTVEQSMECLAGETKVLGENMSQCRFFHHKPHTTRTGLEPRRPQWEAGD
jgi:hypothetical protein